LQPDDSSHQSDLEHHWAAKSRVLKVSRHWIIGPTPTPLAWVGPILHRLLTNERPICMPVNRGHL